MGPVLRDPIFIPNTNPNPNLNCGTKHKHNHDHDRNLGLGTQSVSWDTLECSESSAL